MASHGHHHHGRQRLKFLKSPVAGDSSVNSNHDSDESDPKTEGVPKLKRVRTLNHYFLLRTACIDSYNADTKLH